MQLREVELREIAFADQTQYVGQQQLAMSADRAMRRQNAVIHPALDGRDADAESARYLGRAYIGKIVHGPIPEKIRRFGPFLLESSFRSTSV